MVTAIVTCCKRLHNVERIWEALRGQSQPCESIWFFYNGKETLARGDLPPFDRTLRGDDADDHYSRFAVGARGPHGVRLRRRRRLHSRRTLGGELPPGRENARRDLRARGLAGHPARLRQRTLHARRRGGQSCVAARRRAGRSRSMFPFTRSSCAGSTSRGCSTIRWAWGSAKAGSFRPRGNEDVLLACRAWRRAGVRSWLPSCPEPGHGGRRTKKSRNSSTPTG